MTVFKKMYITLSFPSSRDTKKLTHHWDFSYQDASKYASGGLEKSILKYDPGSGFLTLTHYPNCATILKIRRIENLKKVFSYSLRPIE